MAKKYAFNRTLLANAKVPTAGSVKYPAIEPTGLYLSVSHTGKQTVYFYRRAPKRLSAGAELRPGEQVRVRIPDQDENGVPRTAEQYVAEATLITARIAAGKDPRPRSAQTAAPGAERKLPTLGDLLGAYGASLARRGAPSAPKVQKALERCVKSRFPRLWKKQAHLVDLDDVSDIVSAEVDAGRLDQGDKVRSYISTAYRTALGARANPKQRNHWRDFWHLDTNPAQSIRKVDGSSKKRGRSLSESEVRAYWQRVNALESPRREILTAHLLTGGQRQEQLRKARWDEIDHEELTILIYDAKGRGTIERPHLVPVSRPLLDELAEISCGEYVFSKDGGDTPIGPDYIRNNVTQICDAMEAAGELQRGRFTAGAIRATVTSLLLKNGPYKVDELVLDKLQSHAQSGVSRAHYQLEKYIEEKRHALEMFEALVKGLDPAADQRILEDYGRRHRIVPMPFGIDVSDVARTCHNYMEKGIPDDYDWWAGKPEGAVA
ncbi:hypothetical protein R0137_11025 [Congregibacter brevis]|uniref:Tyr recombinase domain-containing protein n=1 Tax=Congregibacter brevis TaxID=3081201 RepID=A0ABZ0IAE2_9GAMM|nr:hypothetical protein R0137_11025 [Congregibacter sp. IMCC45268]